MDEIYKEIVIRAFQNADRNLSKITEESGILDIPGMSGKKTRHLYNNILNMGDARYLEIGTWKGSTVCSAMYENNATVICIDNWSEFSQPDFSFFNTGTILDLPFGNVKGDFLRNFYRYKGVNNANFIESDCYTLDTSILSKFNIYLYDGNHTEENHYKALVHYINNLDDIFIFIVDDWNWDDVRNGTRESFEKLNLTILYEQEIRLTNNNTPSYDQETWWNGVYVAVLKKN
jgi:hypothetical protein